MTFIDRVDELIGLLGMSQNQFTVRISIGRSAYTNWKNGTKPADETVEQICDRWQLSVDSLKGRAGTDSLEPSPALRKAQADLIIRADSCTNCETVVDRLVWLKEYICTTTGMSEEAWCDWLGTTRESWNAAIQSGRVPDGFVKRAAFLAGWNRDQSTWAEWIKTGHKDALSPLAERELRRIAEWLGRSGLTYSDVVRKLSR